MILMSSSLGLEFIRLVNNGVNYILAIYQVVMSLLQQLQAYAMHRKVKNRLHMSGQILNEVAFEKI